jgi:hypothetical protein
MVVKGESAQVIKAIEYAEQSKGAASPKLIHPDVKNVAQLFTTSR